MIAPSIDSSVEPDEGQVVVKLPLLTSRLLTRLTHILALYQLPFPAEYTNSFQTQQSFGPKSYNDICLK